MAQLDGNKTYITSCQKLEFFISLAVNAQPHDAILQTMTNRHAMLHGNLAFLQYGHTVKPLHVMLQKYLQ